jgi:hypothetical protein
MGEKPAITEKTMASGISTTAITKLDKISFFIFELKNSLLRSINVKPF